MPYSIDRASLGATTAWAVLLLNYWRVVSGLIQKSLKLMPQAVPPLEARKGRILHVVLNRNVFVLVTDVILY